ncbi:MAG TPA: hypothetical protein VGD77_10855 [Gemmatimonadaceae bacterium]
MLRFRGAAIAIALAALVSQRADAQQGRRFENAWYWGVRGGQMVYSTPGTAGNVSQGFVTPWAYTNAADQNKMAPVVGLEWLITRNRGGLYLSYAKGFLSKDLDFARANFSDTTVARAHVGGMRRIDIAGMMFPMVERYAQPYFGLGAAILQVGDLNPVLRLNADGSAPAGAGAQMDTLNAELLNRKAAVSPLVVLGLQARLKPFSVFVQASGVALPDEFILQRTSRYVMSYDIGIRYNVGSSIERF